MRVALCKVQRVSSKQPPIHATISSLSEGLVLATALRVGDYHRLTFKSKRRTHLFRAVLGRAGAQRFAVMRSVLWVQRIGRVSIVAMCSSFLIQNCGFRSILPSVVLIFLDMGNVWGSLADIDTSGKSAILSWYWGLLGFRGVDCWHRLCDSIRVCPDHRYKQTPPSPRQHVLIVIG